MNKKTTPASASDKSQASIKKNPKLEEGYRVYLNKLPHLPEQSGRALFFESHSYPAAVFFAQQLVRNSVEWLVEDFHLHDSYAGDAVQRFTKFVENFWIEPIGAAPEPAMPFCARRHAGKLLEPHPHILAKVSPLIFGDEIKKLSPSALDKSAQAGTLRSHMLTGDIRSKVDALWNAFWSGGIANPIEIIEQVTYLLFLKRLDDLETLEESKSARLKQPMARRIFPEGADARGRAYEDMRWSRFKHFAPAEMFTVVSEHVFPFLRTMGGDGSTYAHHMKDARFTVPTPALLAKVVDMIEQVPMEDRDTKGDLYEYMLGKIASAGQNGQFRTPRHIIQLMVEILQPTPWDVMCDLASGTCGFPVAVSEYLHIHHPEIFRDDAMRDHFHNKLFNAFDFDNTMLRIGSMNMLLHGVENPNIRYRDSLAQEHADEVEKYSLILANSPFAGSLDYENCSKDLLQIVKTKKTELLFLALFIRTLKPGGRAAVIVPDGVLFGSSNAHKTLRQMLVEEQKLDAVISLPGGVFKPYAGVSTAILVFTKTNSGGTDHVLFYDLEADGWSLDDKRTPLLPDEKLGPVPATALDAGEHAKNNLPEVLEKWRKWNGEHRKDASAFADRTAQCFSVPKADIAAQGYDLSLNRYKEVVHEEIAHRQPGEILESLRELESEIQQGMKELEGMVGSGK